MAIVVAIGELLLESISVFCVLFGLVRTLQLAMALRRKYRQRDGFPYNQVRLRFGIWLALALECQLGADILTTTVTPNLESLGKLAIVALIRTFLNFFLNKELEAELKFELRSQELELREQ
ncbi:MAG: DUF1622 domain-containing protein [Cyanobacteria bacterium J06639_1]